MSVYDYMFGIAKSSSQVTTLLGSDPMRFYKFGKAPQKEVRPYAVYRRVYGNPDNSLSCIPSEDFSGIQVDVYAKQAGGAEAVANALRDAFELNFVSLVGENGDDWEPNTGLYSVSRTYEFWLERETTVIPTYTLGLSGDETTDALILSGDEQDSGTDQLVI